MLVLIASRGGNSSAGQSGGLPSRRSRVRIPFPAPVYFCSARSSTGQSNGLLIRRLWVRVPPGAPVIRENQKNVFVAHKVSFLHPFFLLPFRQHKARRECFMVVIPFQEKASRSVSPALTTNTKGSKLKSAMYFASCTSPMSLAQAAVSTALVGILVKRNSIAAKSTSWRVRSISFIPSLCRPRQYFLLGPGKTCGHLKIFDTSTARVAISSCPCQASRPSLHKRV